MLMAAEITGLIGIPKRFDSQYGEEFWMELFAETPDGRTSLLLLAATSLDDAATKTAAETVAQAAGRALEIMQPGSIWDLPAAG